MTNMTTAIETYYKVTDEEGNEPPPAPKATKAATKNAPASTASDPGAVASLIEEIAGNAAAAAAKGAMVSVMKDGKKQIDDMLDEARTHISSISSQYAKPQNLCLHVKLNNEPAKKLKQRVAKVLPSLLKQVGIGQSGGKWPMMIGPTGSGKTVAAGQVAQTLGLEFSHLNCCEGMSETWLFGRQTPNGFIPGEFYLRFKDGGVFLFDEFDAINENVLLAINTALANGHLTNPINGDKCERHKDFMCIAAANTNGKGGNALYTGRTRLDAASLNRFSPFEVAYDTQLERELCADTKLLEVLWELRVKLLEKGSKDVVSTRDIANAQMQQTAGFTLEEILGCLKLSADKANHALYEQALGAPIPKVRK